MSATESMFWSHSLSQAFLGEIPNDVLLTAWSASPAESEAEELRQLLTEWSASDVVVRGWIANAWRQSRASLVNETERLSPEEIAAKPVTWFERMGTDQVLLAVLSEVAEDTGQDVQHILSNLPKGRIRVDMRSRWKALQDPKRAHPTLQVALIGGHPSESPRVRSLEEKFGVQFKWTAAEKSKGLNPGHNSLGDLGAAQAVIVVTGNIGHSTMHCARKAATRLDVPCKYITGITEHSLQDCLAAIRMETNH